jgi:hypothetical protein
VKCILSGYWTAHNLSLKIFCKTINTEISVVVSCFSSASLLLFVLLQIRILLQCRITRLLVFKSSIAMMSLDGRFLNGNACAFLLATSFIDFLQITPLSHTPPRHVAVSTQKSKNNLPWNPLWVLKVGIMYTVTNIISVGLLSSGATRLARKSY